MKKVWISWWREFIVAESLDEVANGATITKRAWAKMRPATKVPT